MEEACKGPSWAPGEGPRLREAAAHHQSLAVPRVVGSRADSGSILTPQTPSLACLPHHCRLGPLKLRPQGPPFPSGAETLQSAVCEWYCRMTIRSSERHQGGRHGASWGLPPHRCSDHCPRCRPGPVFLSHRHPAHQEMLPAPPLRCPASDPSGLHRLPGLDAVAASPLGSQLPPFTPRGPSPTVPSGDLLNLGLVPACLCSGPSKASVLEVKPHPRVLLCFLPLATPASLLPREQCGTILGLCAAPPAGTLFHMARPLASAPGPTPTIPQAPDAAKALSITCHLALTCSHLCPPTRTETVHR